MQDVKKRVGMTAEPKKVIAEAHGEPVAIMNHHQVVGYFIPAEAVNRLGIHDAPFDESMTVYQARKTKTVSGMDYLKDK